MEAEVSRSENRKLAKKKHLLPRNSLVIRKRMKTPFRNFADLEVSLI